MNRILWNKKRAIITLAICAVLAVSSVMLLQLNQTTEAAVIDPHPGLAGWWRFDEGTGSLAEDSSGNGNDGTVYGASWVAGKYGSAINLDGLDDYMKTSTGIYENGGEFTFETWIYPESFPNTWSALFGQSNFPRLQYNSLARRFYMQHLVGGTDTPFISGVVDILGVWTHLAVISYASDNVDFYINGELLNRDTHIGLITHSNPDLNTITFGTPAIPALNLGDMIIDEVKIYNRALSAMEIFENSQKNPSFSSKVSAKMPIGTTQMITTVSWQGDENVNVSIQSPSVIYTENVVPTYQKTTYDANSEGIVNIKRLSISMTALTSAQTWWITLETGDAQDYKITVEIQK